MVVPPLQCNGGDLNNDMESLNQTPIVTISSDSEAEKTENGNSTRKSRTRSSAKKEVEGNGVMKEEVEVETTKEVETPVTERRQSARIKSLVKEREEKEKLAKKTTEALEVNGDGSEKTKKRKRKSNGVGSGSEKKIAGAKNEERESVVMVEEEKRVEMVEEEKEKEKESGENGEVSGNLGPGLGLENGNDGKSDTAKVKETLRLFNSHYLHFVQEEEKRCEAATKGSASKKSKDKPNSKKSKDKGDKVNAAEDYDKKPMKRPDLKAISKMMETNTVLFPEKRFGDIPGIRVGHQFFSRAEMVVLGFHSHWLNGIDYMGQKYKATYPNYEFPIATAIVMSGMYEDDLDNAEDIVYTGQGGHNLTGDKRQNKDQELTRGNLALKNCVAAQVPVRVVRGHENGSSYTGKVYTYDGLYQVVKYWAEKGLSGFTVYKFLLKRIKGQPSLTTSQVQFIYGRVPQDASELRGLVCNDITNGKEANTIPATNLVDDPRVPPTGFRYINSIQVAKNVSVPSDAPGCSCKGSCTNPKTCECARLNGSDFPYVHRDGGRLIEAKDVVYECGPKCGCGPDCVNRASQRGLKYRFEVFRAPRKGWAVRSWDFIPSGAPVCEYIGTLRRSEDLENASENDYIFDIDCLQTMRGIGGRERRSLNSPPSDIINQLNGHDDLRSDAPEFCIDAGSVGNIARFINHSCEPNLFVQCVLSSHRDIKLARVVLFAAENIPPLQELTYDYGYELDSVRDANGKVKKLPCYCGAADCRKRLF